MLTAAACCHYCMSEMLLYVKGGYEAKQQNAKSAMWMFKAMQLVFTGFNTKKLAGTSCKKTLGLINKKVKKRRVFVCLFCCV